MDPLTQDEWDKLFLDAMVRDIQQYLEAGYRNAVKCHCGDRCDPPYGNGKQCMICAARPTAECLALVINI